MGGRGSGPAARGFVRTSQHRQTRLRVRAAADLLGLEDEDSPDILSRHVADAVRQALTAAIPTERVALANKLLQELQHSNRIAVGPTQLQSFHLPGTVKRRNLRRPTMKLRDPSTSKPRTLALKWPQPLCGRD